ncbi:hypothetical protein KSP40_PGU021114 [Platanthera guangdongensis]|uniref:Uncharacterized protein n=1 Tax=Platanthera guangdongensis TaxID=2320717 RepID=A0ABR2MVU7_9ASPA
MWDVIGSMKSDCFISLATLPPSSPLSPPQDAPLMLSPPSVPSHPIEFPRTPPP